MPMRAWVLAVLLALSAAPASAAQKAEWETLDAQKIIDGCWTTSEELRDTGVTAYMAEGHQKTIQCLEEAIKTQMVPFKLDRAKGFAKELADLRAYFLKLGRELHNDNPGCGKGNCGSANGLYSYSLIERVYEQMIRDMVFARKDGEF
jgi:hypothetical protein